MAKASTSKERLRTEENKHKALEYRRAGLTIRQIAQTIGVSRSQVHRYIMSSLKETKKLREDEAELVKELDLQRIDRMIQAVYPRIQNGDLQAIDRMIKLLERRARMLGLDAPNKVAPTNPEGTEAVDFSSMSTEELERRVADIIGSRKT